VLKPFVAALTGSIGMGKTETAKMFARLNIPVHDADATVHGLYDKGGGAVAEIDAAFPGAVVRGSVDRSRLTELVAHDEKAFQRLEAIVHPLVLKERDMFLADADAKGVELVVLDIPLLYETGLDDGVDAIIVVSAPAEVQSARVLQRPGMTLEKLEAIHARQVPDAEKRAKADFVIETDRGLEHAFEQVKRVAVELQRRAKEKR
jgi:dephospho-CoA kinase